MSSFEVHNQPSSVAELPYAVSTRVSKAPTMVFLFPGLGNHYVGMGRGLFDSDAVFRETLERCARLLRAELDIELLDYLYPASAPAATPAMAENKLDLRRMLGRGPEPGQAEQAFNQTWLVQPVLFSVEYALAQALMARGVFPEALIGYSLGEYVAACLAGIISLEDELKLVARRAKLIQSLAPGAMVAVPLSEREVLECLGPELSISAVNHQQLCVIAGPVSAVDELERSLRQRDVVCRRVPTTHAFHSSMMRPLAAELTRLVQGVPLRPPQIPVISNVTGTWITPQEATDPGYWSRHLCETVRFSQGLETLLTRGPVTLVEVGPGRALGSVAMQHHSFAKSAGHCVVSALRYEYDPQSDQTQLADAIALSKAAQASEPSAAPSTEPKVAPPGAGASTSQAAKTLAEIWCDLLKLDAVDAGTHFFNSGGNSLLATRLLYRVRKAFRVDLPLRAVFTAATFEQMLALLDGESIPAPGLVSAPAPKPAVYEQVLPNGLRVATHSPAETGYFYEDIFQHRSYVRFGIELDNDSCVFDVGANIGMFSLFVGSHWPKARLFAFEPAPPLHALLQSNLANNGVSATVLMRGVSDHAGKARFTFYPASSGMSSFYPDLEEEKRALRVILENQLRLGMDGMKELMEYSQELVDQRLVSETFDCDLCTLSEVIAETKVERIDLLKVDVQKAELEVLRGIGDADWPKIQQVVAEVHDIQGRVSEMTRLLGARGFITKVHQDELYRGSNTYNLYARRG
ncbi:MAG TPA: FkbM family methyltransferase [Polyangiaceae bacterium]|nr:FkbM family methyltransferase [Polyangiaceae bacterium]